MQYDFNLPPGGALNLDVKGRFFKYRSGAGPIRVRASKGGYVDLMPGQGVWSLDYDSLNVQDRSGANNAGVLIAGDFDFHDDRIAGTVDVVDGGKSRTYSNSAFMAVAYMAGAAGLMSTNQVWNPLASAVNAIVSKIYIASTSASLVRMGFDTVPPGVLLDINAKIAGGTMASARSSSVGLASISASFKYLAQFNLPAGVTQVVELREPIVLPPGRGLVIQNNNVNTDLSVVFELIEEKI